MHSPSVSGSAEDFIIMVYLREGVQFGHVRRIERTHSNPTDGYFRITILFSCDARSPKWLDDIFRMVKKEGPMVVQETIEEFLEYGDNPYENHVSTGERNYEDVAVTSQRNYEGSAYTSPVYSP
jgi:hypothetical protein